MNLFFQTLSLIGFCFILKYGSILNKFRDFLTARHSFFQDLFKCSLCLGFWVGVIMGNFWAGTIWMIPVWGFYSATVCWFADYLTMVIDKHLNH